MQENNNTNKDFFNVDQDKRVMTVEAQKELATHNAKLSFQYAMKSLLVMIPVMLLLIGGILFIVFTHTGLRR